MAGGGQDDVRVAGQLLDDLLVLEVPDVDLVVLAPGHDPLATRHREVGKHAVLLILVSSVGFQTLALEI